MDLKQLEYFITVVNEGNITAAAHKLYMTQPPLSNQIKLLEKELDCTLFERGARNIRLTDAGQALYNYAQSLLDLADIAKQETMLISKKNNATIRIGIVSSLICSTALEWLISFSQKNPSIHYEIIEGNTYQLLQKFQTSSIHLAILRTPFNQETLNCRSIFADKLIAVGHTKFFSPDEDTTNLAHLSKVPLILYRRWEKIIQNSFHEHMLNPDFFCVNDDARTTMYFVEAGMGVGLVPESAIHNTLDSSLIAKPVDDLNISSEVVLAYSCESHLPDSVKMFIEFMENN